MNDQKRARQEIAGTAGGRCGLPPLGTPFHRLARVHPRNFVRFLLGTLFVLAVGCAAGAAAVFVQKALMGPPGGAMADFVPTSMTLAAFLPVVAVAAWMIQRRSPGSVSSVAGRLRWRWLLTCTALALAAIMVMYGLDAVLGAIWPELGEMGAGSAWVGWEAFLPVAGVVVVVTVFQATAEEYVFRGWLLQGIASCVPRSRDGMIGRVAAVVFGAPWPAIVISAALFTSVHGYTGLGMLWVVLFGLVLGWLAVRTGGLEAGIAFHVVLNINAFLFLAAFGQMGSASEQGGSPWQGFVVSTVPLVLFAVVVVWLARRRGLRAVTGPATDDRPAVEEPAVATA
ncbi:lysostaphin resistance A-like protein [Spirillospora sp. CA-255316]